MEWSNTPKKTIKFLKGISYILAIPIFIVAPYFEENRDYAVFMIIFAFLIFFVRLVAFVLWLVTNLPKLSAFKKFRTKQFQMDINNFAFSRELSRAQSHNKKANNQVT